MKHNEYLAIEEYPEIKKIMEDIFYIDRLLPDYVFKNLYHFTLMADFDYMIGPGLTRILHNSCFCHLNDNILLSVLDPEPVNYFHKHFGKINSIYFKAGISEEDYSSLRWLRA
jgi:hypothetical protein